MPAAMVRGATSGLAMRAMRRGYDGGTRAEIVMENLFIRLRCGCEQAAYAGGRRRGCGDRKITEHRRRNRAPDREPPATRPTHSGT